LQRDKEELHASNLPPNQKIRLITTLHQLRDKAARAKRLAKRILRSVVLERGFRDVERCETVCLLMCVELIGLAGPIMQLCDVPYVERGEVLVDSRGQGSFQQGVKSEVE
jgi:hypothetical protein